ncbi:MAG: flagellar biosynthesis protein FlhF [Deltaproteobacteria bacterium]|nr:flagellar biosynthesis protein FlhF [Deltaproteobacteria bacterium]
MQFETFRGRTVEEAVAAVKASLGSDALIGSTRRVTNERSGQLGASFVEVTAAPSPRNPAQKLRLFPREEGEGTDAYTSRRPARPAQPKAFRAPGPDSPVASSPESRSGELDIREELQAIRSLLEEVTSSQPPRTRATSILRSARIEGKLATRLVAGASRLPPGSDLRRWLRQRIADRLSILPNPIEQRGPRLVVCVGPTGVGKSTTVAKLAARAHLDLGRVVSIISLDTFRVGSVEQMRRFGELIGVSFDVAADRAAFQRALTTRNADITFVDTASLPASNESALRKLNDCLDAAEGRVRDVLLTVPAGIHPHDAERLATAYRAPEPTGVIITKVDEAFHMGGALHAVLPRPLPLAYLCRGPRVPEDLQAATVQSVLDAVLPMGDEHAD